MRAAMPKKVAGGVYQLRLVAVNVFFVEDDEGGLWLIDTGMEPRADRIGGGIRALGRTPRELRGVVVTHLHGDHAGGLAAVKEHTGAEVWMQAEDAAAVREGTRVRALDPGPGPLGALLARTMPHRPERRVEPVAVEHDVRDGDTLPFGATAVHTPGHTAGHLALLLPRDGGVLFAGDAVTNVLRLHPAPFFEDFDEGARSLRKLAGLRFETAVFAHGRPLTPHADERFRARFGGV